MAFRRRSSFRRGGFRRTFRRGSRSWSNKKWIGSHNLFSLTYAPDEPGSQTLVSLPTFIPLVRYTDYGNEALSPMIGPSEVGADQPYTTERQERVTVLRSLGSFKHIIANLAGEESVQTIYFHELWWYFAAYSEDDTLAAAEAATGAAGATALAQYDLGLAEAPPLWRSRMFKHGYSWQHGAWSPVLTTQTAIYHSETARSWDFRPGAKLSTPMNWYLVMGGNMFVQTPVPPEQNGGAVIFVGARTLITD